MRPFAVRRGAALAQDAACLLMVSLSIMFILLTKLYKETWNGNDTKVLLLSLGSGHKMWTWSLWGLSYMDAKEPPLALIKGHQ